jgi:hypothetical protein
MADSMSESSTNLFLVLSCILQTILAWQQNRIFERQNEIFSAQAGLERPEVPSVLSPSRIRELWPFVTWVAVALLTTSAVVYGSQRRDGTVSWRFIVPTIVGLAAFAFVGIRRKQLHSTSSSIKVLEITLDDPRIYLDIEPASETMFARTPFIVRNDGKYEAHHVAIKSFKLCRKTVAFPEIPVVAVGKLEKVLPTVEGEGQLLSHDIFNWLVKDWDGNGKLLEDWPIALTITYSDPLGMRHFEATVTLMFHPIRYLMYKRHNNAPDFIVRHREPSWEFVNPQFRLVQ